MDKIGVVICVDILLKWFYCVLISYRISFSPTTSSVIYQNCVSNVSDGWLAPTSDLGTFEQNCYHFGLNSGYYWSHASKTCVDLGGRLAVIETSAEFMWIMQIYAQNFSSSRGFFVDATRNRYGTTRCDPAWRGGVSLSTGVGTFVNNVNYSAIYSSTCYSIPIYIPEFYLTAAGNLQEIGERSSISNGGYICKKYQTAPIQSTVMYNIGYCFPTLPSGNSCPSGWTLYSPNSAPFCYSRSLISIEGPDEQFRICHGIGADLVYLDASAEYSWLFNSGLMQDSTWHNALNAHRFRYGPAFTYSNGKSVASFAYSGPGVTSWINSNPGDQCSIESCFEICPTSRALGWNDAPCFSLSNVVSNGVCKRPLCGT